MDESETNESWYITEVFLGGGKAKEPRSGKVHVYAEDLIHAQKLAQRIVPGAIHYKGRYPEGRKLEDWELQSLERTLAISQITMNEARRLRVIYNNASRSPPIQRKTNQ